MASRITICAFAKTLVYVLTVELRLFPNHSKADRMCLDSA